MESCAPGLTSWNFLFSLYRKIIPPCLLCPARQFTSSRPRPRDCNKGYGSTERAGDFSKLGKKIWLVNGCFTLYGMKNSISIQTSFPHPQTKWAIRQQRLQSHSITLAGGWGYEVWIGMEFSIPYTHHLCCFKSKQLLGTCAELN